MGHRGLKPDQAFASIGAHGHYLTQAEEEARKASAPQSQPRPQPQPQPTPEPHQPQPSTSDASVSEPDSELKARYLRALSYLSHRHK